MSRGVERAILAKVGALLLALAVIAPAWVSVSSADAASLIVARAIEAAARVPTPIDLTGAAIEWPEALPPRPLVLAAAEMIDDGPPPPPPPEPLVLDGIVLASWYGPGFYGNPTACGQTFSDDIVGVAHRTLACGTRVRITSPSGITVTVPVIDRGPFVAGRSLDLSQALKSALSCSDLCPVRMVVVDR